MITSKFVLMLLIFSSCLYLAGITPISPVYIITPILSCISLIFFNNKKTIDKVLIFFIFIIFCFLFTRFVDSDPRYVINLILGFMVFFTIIVTFKGLSSTVVIQTIKTSFLLIMCLLIVESALRYLMPGELMVDEQYAIEHDIVYYKYKISSIMFGDSNMVGMIIVCISSFMMFVNITHSRNISKIMIFIFFVLCCLTLSRASILAFIISIIFYVYYKRKHIVIFLIPIILIGGTYIANAALVGGSFLTKFEVWSNSLNYLSSKNELHLYLFGVGFGNSPDLLGMAAHNMWLIYLFEGGILFFVVMVLLFMYLILKTKYSLIYMAPIIVNSLSVSIYAGAPPLFMIFALGYILSLAKDNKVSNF